MALEPTYCRGARGDVIAALQEALGRQQVPDDITGAPASALAGADGDFGVAMQRAVQRVQQANGLLMTGVVDAATWALLMGERPWPDAFQRLLFVLAGFEGHMYSKATGTRANDDVGMTWGLIGFTLVQPDRDDGYRAGPLARLLLDLFAHQRPLLVDAFGAADADRLEVALARTAPQLHRFAVDYLSSPNGATLQAPWRAGFDALGKNETVRQMQRELARAEYYVKAQALAARFDAKYGMACERTALYFFDVVVNNGGLTDAELADALAALDALAQAEPDAPVAAKLGCVTDALVRHRNPVYAADLRARKGTLAHGYGDVHGIFCRLEGWAVDVAEPVPQAQPLRLAVLGLDNQGEEQLALARGARNMVVAEEAAAAALAEGRFPAATGYALLARGGTRSVTLRALAEKGAATLNDKSNNHYEAAQMLFRGRTGVLVISGTITRPLSALGTADQYVLQRSAKTYVGLVLKANDQLMLLRQRSSGDALVDVTDLRRGLGDCALVMLYSGYGVPAMGLPGSGPRWRAWIAPGGAGPLVLGWYGNVRPPQDSEKRTLADAFFDRVAKLQAGADLVTLCRTMPAAVIEQWGQACHAVFAASRQRYLWRDEPIAKVLLMASGAAAIDPAGRTWCANGDYGRPGQPAMIEG